MTLVVDEVIQPDGNEGSFATIALRHGVAILPIDDDGFVYITKQFRYALQKESIEVVSCGIEGNQPVIEAGKKDLKEEAGILADDWKYLDKIEQDTSIVKCPVHLYVVKGLQFQEPEQEGTEDFKIFKKPLQKADEMILKGEITHAPSGVLILKANAINH